jgi:membrane protein implicated in regulation of membrane protease activity
VNSSHLAALRRGRATPLLVGVALAVIVAVHVGLAGFLVAHWSWSLSTLAIAVAAKLLALAVYRARRRFTRGRGGGAG